MTLILILFYNLKYMKIIGILLLDILLDINKYYDTIQE